MKAKEKAQELIDKYVALTDGWVAGKNGWEHKKKCALIAVQEIINSRPVITDSQVEFNKFWKDVKSELQSL
jgi:hypothetical protein